MMDDDLPEMTEEDVRANNALEWLCIILVTIACLGMALLALIGALR